MELLAIAGAVSLAATAYSAVRFGYALAATCDFKTAVAPTPSDSCFAGKVVWITGASSGIGRAIALAFDRKSAKLVLTARDLKALEEVKREIAEGAASSDRSKREDEILIVAGDMSNLDGIPDLVERVANWCIQMDPTGGCGVDILVNNAGMSQRSTHNEADFDVDLKLSTLNYLSKVRLTKACLPLLETAARKNGQAVVVNTASVAGKLGVPLRTAYCGSMHAMIGWFDSFRCEERARGTGIRVTNLCVGSTRTNVARNALVANANEKRGTSDPNIDNGLDPADLAERVLAAVAAGVNEVWMCPRQELVLMYLGQYFPDTAKWLVGSAAKKYVAGTVAPASSEGGKKDE